MGFILNAIGAAAGAGGDILGEQRRADTQLSSQKSMADYNSALEQKRQEALAKFKTEQIPAEMEAKAGAEEGIAKRRAEEFSSARSGLIDRSIDSKYAQPIVGNEDTLTPAQKAVMAEGMDKQGRDIAKDKLSLESDPAMIREAGLQTGQISPKEAATMATNADMAQLRADVANARTEQQREMAQSKLDSAMALLNMKIGAGAYDGKSGGKGDSNAAEKNEITRAREKRLDIKSQIELLLKSVDNGLTKRTDGTAELQRLRGLQRKYDDIIDGAGEPTAKPAEQPHKEGARLRGPDGKTYVVKNGQPVLEK